MKKFITCTALGAVLFGATALLSAKVETYDIDTVHSGVSFKVRHFFTPVPGSFANFSGTIQVDQKDMTKNHVKAEIAVASVDTNNTDRDEHLLADDYFNEAEFPTMTFESTKWEKTGEDTFKVTGDFTMMGQTHPVTLDVTLLGQGEMRDRYLIGWSATGTLDREQWGLNAGAGVIGDEVSFELNIEGIRQS